MKKPYIKKYGKVSDFTVWIVNGKYIRENINEEFTNFSHHYHFNFIPEHELWIDKEHGEGSEISYFIDNMLTEIRLLKEGKSIDEAIRKADAVERRERAKSRLMHSEARKKLDKAELIKQIHKRLLKEYSKKVKVWIVNGELVRDFFFLDFTEGGHDKVYPFIPENEVWMDDDVSQKERKFILLHELHERNLMCQGWCYDPEDKRAMIKNGDKNPRVFKSAHKAASELEFFYRRNPKGIDKQLKEEVR
jgi:hypothetical protein